MYKGLWVVRAVSCRRCEGQLLKGRALLCAACNETNTNGPSIGESACDQRLRPALATSAATTSGCAGVSAI